MPRWLGFALFLAVVLGTIGGVHYFLWVRLVRNPHWPAPWRTVGTVAAIGLAVGTPALLVLSRFLPRSAAEAIAWPAFVWFGTMFLLFVLLLIGDVVRLGSWSLARLGADAPPDPGRRRQMARALAAAAGAAVAIGTPLAVSIARQPARVRTIEIPLPRLPRPADGTTIVQITDLHVGPTLGRAFVDDIVRRVNELSPDVVAITGDLMDGSVEDLRDAVAPLADLRARHGAYFVTGNHEYYSPTASWMRHIASLGIRILHNQRVSIGEGAAAFDLAGVDDWSAAGSGVPGHGADLPRALAGRDPARAVVLLAHQPKHVREAAAAGVDLQLSGHTHAGQIWPFSWVVRLTQPYVAGLHREDATWIYVSPGTGYWGPPMRVATHPEITRVVLRAG